MSFSDRVINYFIESPHPRFLSMRSLFHSFDWGKLLSLLTVFLFHVTLSM